MNQATTTLTFTASSVSLQWPASSAAECGAWLREWLR
jgi:hypothetical protein